MRAGARASLRTRDPRRHRKAPSEITAVAQGRYWLPSSATGIGTAGFSVPEGNGAAAWALVQATVATQPTALSENGQVQFRMRSASDPNPCNLRTAGSVAAGWTGPTVVAGWFRLPDAAGAITGAGNLFHHFLTTGNQRRIIASMSTTVGETVNCDNSITGATFFRSRWATPFTGAAWRWIVLAYDQALALGGAALADKFKLFVDGVLLARSQSIATDPTALFDGAAPVHLGCREGGLGNADTTDVGPVYYCNGIPSEQELRDLRSQRPPIQVAV